MIQQQYTIQHYGMILCYSTLCHMCIYISRMCMCVLTYIHIYIYTYTYTHTCMHACMHAYIHELIHSYMHACMHSYIQSYIHTYIHTCIHTYIHTHMYRFHPELRVMVMGFFGAVKAGARRDSSGPPCGPLLVSRTGDEG